MMVEVVAAAVLLLLGLPATSPTNNTGAGTTPAIDKRMRWFVGSARGAQRLLLDEHSDVCTGILPCCNVMGILPNGTLRAPRGNSSAYRAYSEAGKTVHVSINSHGASVDAAFVRKEAFAAEVQATALRLNLSGITLDFEDGNGDHIEKWVGLWSAVRDALHARDKTIGNCVCQDVWLKPNATGDKNFGGANKTAWAFLWDVAPQVPVFDFFTDMSTCEHRPDQMPLSLFLQGPRASLSPSLPAALSLALPLIRSAPCLFLCRPNVLRGS